MKKRQVKVQNQQGNRVEGVVVSVAESTERFSEVKLEDGTILKTKLSPLEAVRVNDQWDNDGNPVYVLKSQNVVVVSESPDTLKKDGSIR